MILAVSGSSKVGKSTLIDDFINKYPRYGKPAKTYRDIPDLDLYENGTEESQRLIRDFMFKSHKEFWAKRDTNKRIVHDRCLLDNLAVTMFLKAKNPDSISDDFLLESIKMTRESMGFYHQIYFIPIVKADKIPVPDDLDVDFRNGFNAQLQFFFRLWEARDFSMGIFPEKNCSPIFEVWGSRDVRLAIMSQLLDENGDLEGGMGGAEMTPTLFGANGMDVTSQSLNNPAEFGLEDFGFSAPNTNLTT